jgi:ATP-binding cassette subfamily F protein 3
VQADYFAQDQYKELDPDARMIDDLSSVAAKSTQTELRTLLGCFLFSEDDVFKRIGVLSGGERNRYALARMLLQPSNFLLLDEPTNHLDMRAKDVLLQALEKFSGTVVFVSHDRYFIDKLATRVFEVADGGVHVFAGNYEEYIWRKEGRGSQAAVEAAPEPKPAAASPASPAPKHEAIAASNSNGKADTKARRLNPIKLKQMRERRREIEEEVTRMEISIAECEQALANFVSVEHTQEITDLLARRRQDLEDLLREWEEVSLALEG